MLLIVYKGLIRSVVDWGSQIFHLLDEKLFLKASRLLICCPECHFGSYVYNTHKCAVRLKWRTTFFRWQFLLEKFLCEIAARQSHPLNNILHSLHTCNSEERITSGSLIDTFRSNKSLFEQIDQFQLPGYLEFPYSVRHFTYPIYWYRFWFLR